MEWWGAVKNNMEVKKNTLMWVIIGVLFLSVLFLTFKLGSSGAGISDIGTTGKIDTTGWTTNEIMNYEMHGTIPARAGKISATTGASGGMVGAVKT